MELKIKVNEEHPDSLFDLFHKIEKTSGRNDKMDLLRLATEKQRFLLVAAFNPYMQFHITKWGHTPFSSPFKSDQEAYLAFVELLQLAIKSNRSSYLEDRTSEFFSRCNPTQNFWFGRIINKDLKFGLQSKSINKIFPELIPTFDVMLAETVEPDFSNVDFRRNLCIERKYDGFRVVVKVENGILDVVGRSGKPILNRQFVSQFEKIKDGLEGFVLDGEGYCHTLSFETFSGIMRREDESLPDDFKFYMFDVLTLNEWKGQHSINLEDRLERRFQMAALSDFLVDVPYWTINGGTPEIKIGLIKEFFDRFLDEGYEGAMLKYADKMYQWKRGDAMLKIKPQDTIDLQIVGWYSGQAGTKFEAVLGGFSCVDENGTEIRVGGGFKDYERSDFWAVRESLLGRWIEVEFTEKTAKDSLRHPRFKRLRDDK